MHEQMGGVCARSRGCMESISKNRCGLNAKDKLRHRCDHDVVNKVSRLDPGQGKTPMLVGISPDMKDAVFL